MKIHEADEVVVVGGLYKMNHLMHDQVFQAGLGLFRELGVEAYRPFILSAAAPFSLHAPDVELVHADSQPRFPFIDEFSVKKQKV